MRLLRKFWFQLCLAVLLGAITGTLWSMYQHRIQPAPIQLYIVPATTNNDQDDDSGSDCGWDDEEECPT